MGTALPFESMSVIAEPFLSNYECLGMWCLDDARHGICLLGDESHGICLSHAECRVIFLPDDECQGMLPPDDARHGIYLLDAAHMFPGISYELCLSVYRPLPTRGNQAYA